MTYQSSFEQAVAAVVASLADLAPTDVDPVAVTRSVSGTRRFAFLPGTGLAKTSQRLALVVLLVVLLISTMGGAILVGSQLLGRDIPPTGGLTVIAKYARIHAGFVFVYDDGLVLAYRSPDMVDVGMVQRHLTPGALDRVRSGELLPQSLLWKFGSCPWISPAEPLGQQTVQCQELGASQFVRDDEWVESRFEPYHARSYALCFFTEGGDLSASSVLPLLSGRLADLLSGKQEKFLLEGLANGTRECFEVTADERAALDGLVSAGDGLPAGVWSEISEVLPHHAIVAWGG